MKLTNEQIKKIIKEELENVVEEGFMQAPMQMSGPPVAMAQDDPVTFLKRLMSKDIRSAVQMASAAFQSDMGRAPSRQEIKQACDELCSEIVSGPMGPR